MKIPYFSKHSKVPFLNWWLKFYPFAFNMDFGYYTLEYDFVRYKTLNLKILSIELMDSEDSD
jgi:hypothetical protein